MYDSQLTFFNKNFLIKFTISHTSDLKCENNDLNLKIKGKRVNCTLVVTSLDFRFAPQNKLFNIDGS